MTTANDAVGACPASCHAHIHKWRGRARLPLLAQLHVVLKQCNITYSAQLNDRFMHSTMTTCGRDRDSVYDEGGHGTRVQ